MEKIIGIDLGTTNSCVSVFEGNKPIVITNSEGKRTTPSVVAFMKDGERKVGDPAKRQAITNPRNTVSSIKRFIGETYNNVFKESSRVQYQIECSKDNIPCVNIDGHLYTPQEISAIILRKMKKTAEDYLGQEVTDAVITVPAYFNDNQRQATKDAGLIAGLNVRYIINEPTAAALAYGVDKADMDMKIAVFDFGGGTFDISILEFGRGVFEVLSTNGDTHLGGDDFDQIIIDWLVREFQNDAGVNLKNDPMAMLRLKEASEKAKIELSSSISTEINLPYIMSVDGVPRHLVRTLTRAKFEQMTQGLIQACLTPCQEAMTDAGLRTTDIDKVILVGGSSRIPAIQQFVENFFGKVPSKSVNPDEAVAIGASIRGAVCNNEVAVGDIALLDVIPLPIGIETSGGVMTQMILANSTIPCRKKEVFSTAADNQTEVTIHVLQGNRPMASQNTSIGQFNLTGIAPARRGVPQIEVTFDIDANGILKVSAKDQATGKEHTVRINESIGLSKKEIERMKEEIVTYERNGNIKCNKKYDVFISAKSVDYPIAEKVYNFLVRNGYSVFLACHELDKLGEAEYSEEIDKVLDETTHMIVVSTDISYINSKWVKFEWSTFCNDLKSGWKNGNIITILSPTIPVRDLPASLRHKQSFTTKDYQNHILSYITPVITL